MQQVFKRWVENVAVDSEVEGFVAEIMYDEYYANMVIKVIRKPQPADLNKGKE